MSARGIPAWPGLMRCAPGPPVRNSVPHFAPQQLHDIVEALEAAGAEAAAADGGGDADAAAAAAGGADAGEAPVASSSVGLIPLPLKVVRTEDLIRCLEEPEVCGVIGGGAARCQQAAACTHATTLAHSTHTPPHTPPTPRNRSPLARSMLASWRAGTPPPPSCCARRQTAAAPASRASTAQTT